MLGSEPALSLQKSKSREVRRRRDALSELEHFSDIRECPAEASMWARCFQLRA